MAAKTRIAVLGIGGVGGYFGGLLADRYFNSPEVEIIFITRPATKKIIKQDGLRLITPQYEKVIFPEIVASDPVSIGQIDWLVCCVKGYDLEESLVRLSNCISSNTVILPLLNGVDAHERISSIYPDAEVWFGCVYIVSRLMSPGIVKETGTTHSLYFGSQSAPGAKLMRLEKIFKDANIDAHLSENIESVVWEKFIFISGLASLTSYFDKPIGAILSNEDSRQLLIVLIKELISIANAKNIQLPENIFDKTIKRVEGLPFEATSSMHSDFKKGGKTEYLSLTGYVVKAGDELNIETPGFDRVWKGLKEKMS